MAGNKIGGKKAAQTTIRKHGADFYRRIGAKGGSRTGKKGFAISGKASLAGYRGGKISRHGKKLNRLQVARLRREWKSTQD